MARTRKRSWRTQDGEERQGWQLDWTDHAGRRHRKAFSTKREADAFRVQIEGQLASGTFRADADKITVADLAKSYVAYVTGRCERGERFTRHHLETVEGRIHNYIIPDPNRRKRSRGSRLTPFDDGLGSVKLARLTAGVVGDFRDRLRDAGVSVTTTRKILSTLSAMLAFAMSKDLVATNAAAGVRVIGKRDEGAQKIVPPPKAVLRALLNVADPDFRVRLLFAALTGVRAGELHALRWRHLDLGEATVRIEARVDRFKDEDVTKTIAGMRELPLNGDLVGELKQWRLRSKFSRSDDLVFPNSLGRYENHDNMVQRAFNPLFRALADRHEEDPAQHPPAPERFNWHALRHFAVSLWIEAGLSPKTVQTYAGHSSLQITMDRYGHLFPSEDRQIAMDTISKGLLS